MAGAIAVDLSNAQECSAAEMIKFLFAFCRSGNDQTVPVHDESLLERAFEEARNLAHCEGSLLEENLNGL